MQKTVLLLVLFAIGLNICNGQINIPMNKQTIRPKDSEYNLDSIYTFDQVYKYLGKEYTLKTIIDLQNNKDWVVDDTCSNCFTSRQTTHGIHCSGACSTDTYDPPYLVLSDRIKVTSASHIQADITLDKHQVTLYNVYDVFELRNNRNNPIDRYYLDHAQAGLAFSANSLKNSKSSLSQVFKQIQDTKSSKQVSLFINQEMGRLMIGKTESFFSQGELFKFSAIEEESNGALTWGVKMGPHFTIKDSPNVSTTDRDVFENTKIADLLTVYFDSNTKFMEFPLGVWNRLNKILFSFNNCSTDSLGNSICDCSGRNSKWVPIGFDFINNPQENSYEKNTSRFTIHPESYLEEIQGGKYSGKCLLLIKPSETVEAAEYFFGSSFLQNYYTIYNFENKSISLVKSHGFVPTALHLNDNYRLPFIIAGCILAFLLILILLACLKGVKVPEEPQQDYYKPHQTTSVSYLVRSPREVESIQQITKSVKSTAPIGTPIQARVINSPYRVGYTQSQLYQ